MFTTISKLFGASTSPVFQKKKKVEEGREGGGGGGGLASVLGEQRWGGMGRHRAESVVGMYRKRGVVARAGRWAKEGLGKVAGLLAKKDLSPDVLPPSVRVALLQQLQRIFRSDAYQGGVEFKRVLGLIRASSEELAEALSDRGIKYFQSGDRSRWTHRFISWVVEEVKGGRLEREGEGSIHGCAFNYSKVLAIIHRVIEALETGEKTYEYFFFDARRDLEVFDVDVAHGLSDICIGASDFKTEVKVEFLWQLVEDIEACVRTYHDSTRAPELHLRSFSYLLGPPPYIILPPHRIALHGYGSSSPSLSLSSSTDKSSTFQPEKRVRFEVDEAVVHGPMKPSFDDWLVERG